MIRPRRTRRDRNHADVVRDLRALGAVVWDTADLGGQVLDTLVCWRGVCLPVEIKARGKRDDLTDGEREGIAALEAVGVEALVVESAEEVVERWPKT